MKKVAIIQARMGSERLPGKVLQPIGGRTMLEQVVRRTQWASQIDEIVIATTKLERDNPIAELCRQRDWLCYRGSENDVLARYVEAARMAGASIVVRITSDCPLIDPNIIDAVTGLLTSNLDRLDYVCNFLPVRTFPRGLDVEACTRSALEQADTEDTNPEWREHVTEYMLHNPHRFRAEGLTTTADMSMLRWTVDTPDDLRLVRSIFEQMGDKRFGWRDVLDAYERNPDWATINSHIVQKAVA